MSSEDNNVKRKASQWTLMPNSFVNKSSRGKTNLTKGSFSTVRLYCSDDLSGRGFHDLFGTHTPEMCPNSYRSSAS